MSFSSLAGGMRHCFQPCIKTRHSSLSSFQTVPNFGSFPFMHRMISILLHTQRRPSRVLKILSLCSCLFSGALFCKFYSFWFPQSLSSISLTQGVHHDPLCFSLHSLEPSLDSKWGQSEGSPCSRFTVLHCQIFSVLKTVVLYILSGFLSSFQVRGWIQSLLLYLVRSENIQTRVFG